MTNLLLNLFIGLALGWHGMMWSKKCYQNNVIITLLESLNLFILLLGHFCVQVIFKMKICYFLAICGLKEYTVNSNSKGMLKNLTLAFMQ